MLSMSSSNGYDDDDDDDDDDGGVGLCINGQIGRRKKKDVVVISVTRLGDLLDFGKLFKAFGNN